MSNNNTIVANAHAHHFHYEGAFVFLTAPVYDSQVVSKDVQEKPPANSHWICRDKGDTSAPFLGSN